MNTEFHGSDGLKGRAGDDDDDDVLGPQKKVIRWSVV